MKKRLKLPVVTKRVSNYPLKAICPICKKRKVFEPHSFVVLSGGAILINRKNNTSITKKDTNITSDNLDACLDIIWHGAHGDGVGNNREIFTGKYIAYDVRGGWFDLYFCSPKCLRLFFNKCVDEFELSTKKAMRESLQWPINKKRKRGLTRRSS
jgi:hypothetical protein